MDVRSLIKSRLLELGLEQKELAAAADVTESYVSQLLTQKKLPPAPDRTDIYDKMSSFLQLSNGELEKLARAQRLEEYRRSHEEPQPALLQDTRELLMRKCSTARQEQIRSIFEKQPFGELEQFVTHRLIDVASRVAKSELDNKGWLREVARLSGRQSDQMRGFVVEFLDADIFDISNAEYSSFLDALIARWDIDLSTFDMEIALNESLVPGAPKQFAFVEKASGEPDDDEPGLCEFLNDAVLSRDISDEEVEYLKSFRFRSQRPNRLFFYRALQNLRDPLHFRAEQE